MNIEDEILKIIKEKNEKTHCGASLKHISSLINIKEAEIKLYLNKLFKDKKISVSEGLNHKLVFIRNSKKNIQQNA